MVFAQCRTARAALLVAGPQLAIRCWPVAVALKDGVPSRAAIDISSAGIGGGGAVAHLTSAVVRDRRPASGNNPKEVAGGHFSVSVRIMANCAKTLLGLAHVRLVALRL